MGVQSNKQIPVVVKVLRKQLTKLENVAADTYARALTKNLPFNRKWHASSQVERVNQLLTFVASHPCHQLTLREIGLIVGAGSYAITSLVEAAEEHGIVCRNPRRGTQYWANAAPMAGHN